MELAEKLEAALVKYLQTLDPPYPAYFDKATQIKPGETDEDLDNQYIRCRADTQADEEYPLETGNFWWSCEVELRTPSADQTESEAASESLAESTEQVAKHKALAAILEDAIQVDNLPDLLNTAATALGSGYELTVMAVQNRQPARAQEDEVYSSGISFRVYCCSRSMS